MKIKLEGDFLGKIILVTGGARSGKSTFAEKTIQSIGKNLGYIATAEVLDEEMAFRVKLHRERRGNRWKTYEEPHQAHQAILKAEQDGCDAILFDCLTLYMSNLICSMEKIDEQIIYERAKEKIELLLQQAKKFSGTIVFVTNEVGDGIVPDNAMSRCYRDIVGLANQWIAREADEVFLTVCGIPVKIK